MKSVPKNIKNQEVNTSKKSFFKRPAEQSFFSNVQTKLTVGQPGDKYEVEADAMADKVVQRMHQPEAESQTSFFQSFQGNTALQSKCDTCEEEVQTKETEDITDALQTKAFIDTDSIGNDVSNDASSAPVPTLSLVSNTQPFIAKSSLEQEEVQTKEEETDEQLMPKLEAPVLQRSAQASVRDEASIRARIVEIAQGELGGVEAKKTDSTGRRIGYHRLLDYFHLAAPNVWPDSVIEFKREGFPSWCGIFSVFVIKTAGIDVGNWQMGKGVSAFNSLKVTSNPQPGDIGYIDQPYQHHCIITEVNGDTIKSIDGNSGWHSEVIEKTRSRSKYSGFFTAFTGSEKYIQKREEGNLSDTSDQNISSQLNSSKGAGSPLPSDTKDQMESSFGADFSGVRIHTDSRAEGMSNALHAQAFTNGNDVYFNKGKYNTTNTEGQHLLAHELTHTIQQGAAVQKKEQISSTTSGIQRLFDFDLSSLNRYARYIPGWTLFTVLMGYNPLLGETVDRNAVNVLDGLMGLAPLGTLIFNKLQEHNIITDAYDWTLEQLEDLNLTSEGVVRMFEQAWEEMDFVRTDPFDFNVGVLTRKFESLYNRVRTFAIRVADKVFTMIKDVLINTVKTLAAAIPGYTLLTKIIHHDPLTDTPVEATTAEIVEEFLLMVGAEQELEKMKETGKLEETATWIDEQLAILDFSLEDISLAFVTAWEAFSVNDLLEPAAALERTVAIFAPFATKVFTFASNVVSKVFELIKQYLLGLLKEAANVVPGYHLLTVILEKDPFTEEHVPRTAENLIRGFMGLIPGGEAQFQQMKESGAIGRLTDWLNAEVEALGLTWEYIKNMFLEIWDSFTIENLMDPAPAFQQIIARFGEPLGRLVRFVVRLVMKVIEIILQLMNFPLDLIQNIISNARQAFADIKKDPIGFLKNILRAIKEGFSLFFTNIGTHLLNGVTDWLFGQLDEAGITPPPDFSFKSILNMVMQILGITAERIMDKIAQRIGPEKMERIRGMAETLSGVWGFVKDVVERGPIAIWEKIKEKLTSLWDIVIDGIKGWIITKIITQVTTKLLSLLDPTGIMAVINSCIAFYKAIESFIQYLREMLEIVNSFVAGVAEIARGSVQSAAKFLEGALSQGLPIAIGFLANQVGLGSLGRKIGEMIDKVREMVDVALDWLVDKAVSAGEGLINMGRGALNTVAGWLGFRNRFTTNSGIPHTMYVRETGNRRDLIIESTPMNISAFLLEKRNEVSTNTTMEPNEQRSILGKITHTQNLVQGLQALMNNEAEQDNPRIPQMITEITNNVKEIDVVGGDNVLVPSAEFTPGFSSGVRATSFAARYIYKGSGGTPRNHEPGTTPSSRALPDAWQVLIDMGLNYRWVRFHILNENLGGKGVDSNLIPTPTYLNNEYKDELETDVKGFYDSGLPIWLSSQISYNTSDFNGYFPSHISTRAGAMKFENEQWVEDPSKQRSFSKNVDTPESQTFNINNVMNNPSEDMLVRNLTSVTQGILDLLRANMPSGGYQNFRQMERVIERDVYGEIDREVNNFDEDEIANLPGPTEEQIARAERLKGWARSANFIFN